MEQDLFTYLPPEIIINILSRVPVGTALICKCVRKSWLGLVESAEFAKSHFSTKSASTTLALFQGRRSSKAFKIVKFTADELDPQNFAHQCNAVFNFSFPDDELIHSSVNGLLFLCNQEKTPRDLFICNPITRDYIKLPPPPKEVSTSSNCRFQLDTFGFGVSKRRGEYKVVRMFHEWSDNPGPWAGLSESKCEVYTLGTGSWRSVATGGMFLYQCMNLGVFVEGNLHCMVNDYSDGSKWISCFDLETELFSMFSTQYLGDGHCSSVSLCALGDCLCLSCENSFFEIGIWLMKVYGDEKSWRKEFLISRYNISSTPSHGCFLPIKVFKDGTIILLGGEHTKLFYHSSKTRTIQEIDITGWFDEIDTCSAVIYTPSFLPLKTFAMENVSSF